MTEFWILRHGQTEWNTEKRLQGRLDSPLTALGEQQARQAGLALARQEFSLAWCSSAPRARKTAQLVNEGRAAPLEFRESDALTEMHFGVWEGHTKTEILDKWGEQAKPFWHAPEHFEPFGGETFAQAERRITAFLQHAAKLAAGPQLLITHGMMIQLLLHSIRSGQIHRLYDHPFVLQASLTRVVVDPETPPSAWEIAACGTILS